VFDLLIDQCPPWQANISGDNNEKHFQYSEDFD